VDTVDIVVVAGIADTVDTVDIVVVAGIADTVDTEQLWEFRDQQTDKQADK